MPINEARATIIDEIIELHERILGSMFSRTKRQPAGAVTLILQSPSPDFTQPVHEDRSRQCESSRLTWSNSESSFLPYSVK